uniref:Non-canonical non-ribosomal peptide synthetase FUB8 ) n=1 Tax=Ganoderma boninense TaxID=34458 RepID=A0A5K1K7V0_9APHY|nr:Non-canonical non-ribosomal peptide synthetase FUB8 (EC (Fusaric acid biosynthesis protein 8) [Ganoderma boninense]
MEELLTEEAIGIAMAAAQAEEEGCVSVASAKRLPEWPRWEQAMRGELVAPEKHDTWRNEHAPRTTEVVSSKWVFRAKEDASGKAHDYRAHLVTRGFSQVRGQTFNTYAPVALAVSMRTALPLASSGD